MKTAVEWYNEEINKLNVGIDARMFIAKLFEKAKEMEKEQIVNAWENCKKSTECKSPICQRKTGNGYFNKTFKNTENENR